MNSSCSISTIAVNDFLDTIEYQLHKVLNAFADGKDEDEICINMVCEASNIKSTIDFFRRETGIMGPMFPVGNWREDLGNGAFLEASGLDGSQSQLSRSDGNHDAKLVDMEPVYSSGTERPSNYSSLGPQTLRCSEEGDPQNSRSQLYDETWLLDGGNEFPILKEDEDDIFIDFSEPMAKEGETYEEYERRRKREMSQKHDDLTVINCICSDCMERDGFILKYLNRI